MQQRRAGRGTRLQSTWTAVGIEWGKGQSAQGPKSERHQQLEENKMPHQAFKWGAVDTHTVTARQWHGAQGAQQYKDAYTRPARRPAAAPPSKATLGDEKYIAKIWLQRSIPLIRKVVIVLLLPPQEALQVAEEVVLPALGRGAPAGRAQDVALCQTLGAGVVVVELGLPRDDAWGLGREDEAV